jgi:hypothetical protein
MIDVLGLANARRHVWVPSRNFGACKLLELAVQQFGGAIFCWITRRMLVKDIVQMGISNWNDCFDHPK